MLYLGPYELLIIVAAIGLLIFGPVVAGGVLAFVRRRRGKDGGPRAG